MSPPKPKVPKVQPASDSGEQVNPHGEVEAGNKDKSNEPHVSGPGGQSNPQGEQIAGEKIESKEQPAVSDQDPKKKQGDSESQPSADPAKAEVFTFRIRIFQIDGPTSPPTDASQTKQKPADGMNPAEPAQKPADDAKPAEQPVDTSNPEKPQEKSKAPENKEPAGQPTDGGKLPKQQTGGNQPVAGPKMTPITVIELAGFTLEAFDTAILESLRSKISPVMNQTFRFCMKDGAFAQDDQTLASYLQISGIVIHPSNQIPVYIIPFKRAAVSVVELLDNGPFLLKFIQLLDGKESQNEGTLHSSTVSSLAGGSAQLSEIRKYVKAISANPKVHQFCLPDGHSLHDSITLRDYVASSMKPAEEKVASGATPSIDVYFCKPGVLNKPKTRGASEELLKNAALKLDMAFKGSDHLKVERDRTLLQLKEELLADSFKIAGTSGDNAKPASRLTEDEWHLVIRNCNLMYGWTLDLDHNRVVRAPKPAFQLRKGLNMNMAPAKPKPGLPVVAPTAVPAPATSTPAAPAPAPASVGLPTIETAEKAQAIPNYAIDDDSRIEVTMVTHQFQKSLAESHFSATSVEASVSGGYGGVSAGVSGGYSSENLTEKKETDQTTERTMIGTYRFPRATVHLTPGDLEPTEEFKEAINQIRTGKNIADLRRLHKDFGHLFCQKVVIGGCLQTTKVIKMTKTSEETTEKNQFKVSVGVAVQSPWVSVSTKASHEKGDGKQTGSETIDTKEKLVFEATGGNTILASDPIRWTTSLVDYNNWRVIQQDKPSSLADILSQAPGYSEAPMWFAQAIPTLSRYVEVPRSRALNVRFKTVLDQPGIARILGIASHKYLGHNTQSMPNPIHIGLEARKGALSSEHGSGYMDKGNVIIDMTAFTTHKIVSDTPLFSPKKTHAPQLISYDGKLWVQQSESADKQAEFSKQYKQTVWKLEVPDGDILTHESRVSIRSLASEPNPTLTVYRNQQGVYLPTLTSNGGPSFWRVLKCDPTSQKDDPIRDGDNIRLSWRFSDQTDGFRDFFDDTFGRRRFTKPDEAGDALFLKVPYPPLQSSPNIALMMSFVNTVKPIVEPFRVLPSSGGTSGDSVAHYNLHDVSFRLDSTGDGLGEAKDYMAPITDKEGIPNIVWRQDSLQLKAPAQLVADALLPHANGSIMGPMLQAILF